MSSPDRPSLARRTALRFALAAGLGLALAGCFRPLHGPTASGQQLDDVLAAIDVAPVTTSTDYERLGHYLRNELIFDLNGSGVPAPKRYRLALAFDQRLSTPIVDTTTGRAQTANVTGTVIYTLTSLSDDKVVTTGRALGYVSYDRSAQRFATVRAARDADIRLAKTLSEQIRIRLATALATRA
jgi:LPS-assembly lipoprotein